MSVYNQSLSDESLNQLFHQARTFNHWQDKPVSEPSRDCRRPKTLRQYPYEKQTIPNRS